MSTNPNFDILLKEGEEFERLVKTRTIECKKDNWCIKSKMVAIEIEQDGKISGLKVTKAGWYTFGLSKQRKVVRTFSIPTWELKQLVNKWHKLGNRPKYMGHKKESLCYLIPVKFLFNEFI